MVAQIKQAHIASTEPMVYSTDVPLTPILSTEIIPSIAHYHSVLWFSSFLQQSCYWEHRKIYVNYAIRDDYEDPLTLKNQMGQFGPDYNRNQNWLFNV